MKKIILSLAMLMGISACSDPIDALGPVKSKQELGALKIEDYALEVCHALRAVSLDHLKNMTTDYFFEDLKEEVEEMGVSKARSLLSDKLTCEIQDVSERRSFTTATFKGGRIDIIEENGTYLTKDLD